MKKRSFKFYAKIMLVFIIIAGCALIFAVWTVDTSVPGAQGIITKIGDVYFGIVGLYLLVGAICEIKNKWLKKKKIKCSKKCGSLQCLS